MKNEEKIRMLLHPEQYSDEQLDQMLGENDTSVPDVDEEWQRFRAGLRHRHHSPMRWAAILTIGIALSGISYAAIKHWRQVRAQEETAIDNQHQQPAQTATDKESTYNLNTVTEERDTVRQDQSFNNVELQQIMQQVARDYGVKVVFRNEAARSLRFYLKWEAKDSIQDIINHINHFEKVHLTLSDATITIE
ncbi:MAG: DUF4974 domain-containing protein [Prevotella sp.]|nr:DUF4974 domain-containing protein [Prevotella sp.]